MVNGHVKKKKTSIVFRNELKIKNYWMKKIGIHVKKSKKKRLTHKRKLNRLIRHVFRNELAMVNSKRRTVGISELDQNFKSNRSLLDDIQSKIFQFIYHCLTCESRSVIFKNVEQIFHEAGIFGIPKHLIQECRYIFYHFLNPSLRQKHHDYNSKTNDCISTTNTNGMHDKDGSNVNKNANDNYCEDVSIYELIEKHCRKTFPCASAAKKHYRKLKKLFNQLPENTRYGVAADFFYTDQNMMHCFLEDIVRTSGAELADKHMIMSIMKKKRKMSLPLPLQYFISIQWPEKTLFHSHEFNLTNITFINVKAFLETDSFDKILTQFSHNIEDSPFTIGNANTFYHDSEMQNIPGDIEEIVYIVAARRDLKGMTNNFNIFFLISHLARSKSSNSHHDLLRYKPKCELSIIGTRGPISFADFLKSLQVMPRIEKHPDISSG